LALASQPAHGRFVWSAVPKDGRACPRPTASVLSADKDSSPVLCCTENVRGSAFCCHSKTGSPHRQLRHLSLCDQQTVFASGRLVLCGPALSKPFPSPFPSNDAPRSRLGTAVTNSQQAVQADQPRQDHSLPTSPLPPGTSQYTNHALRTMSNSRLTTQSSVLGCRN
jgi:hypothetical protein